MLHLPAVGRMATSSIASRRRLLQAQLPLLGSSPRPSSLKLSCSRDSGTILTARPCFPGAACLVPPGVCELTEGLHVSWLIFMHSMQRHTTFSLLIRGVSLPFCCRIASSAEEALRARLAQREQRMAELSAALGSMQTRAAEDRRRSSQSADEQCRSMTEAATRAEPLLKRLSEAGSLASADIGRATQISAPELAGPASSADDSQAQVAYSEAACDALDAEQGGIESLQTHEAQQAPGICLHDTAGERGQSVSASADSADPAATASGQGMSAMQSALQRSSRESMEPSAAAAAPSTLLSAPGDNGRRGNDVGVSTHTLRLAEEAEDLRLELAQRTAQAAGLQSWVDHLMACQGEHEQTEASQAAQLAAQSEVSLPAEAMSALNSVHLSCNKLRTTSPQLWISAITLFTFSLASTWDCPVSCPECKIWFAGAAEAFTWTAAASDRVKEGHRDGLICAEHPGAC